MSDLRYEVKTRFPASVFVQDELKQIKVKYSASDWASVDLYLNENPVIREILLEASERIHDYFPNAPLILSLHADPKAIDPKELVLSISTDLQPKEARARLKKFDYDWWLPRIHKARHLIISLEYK